MPMSPRLLRPRAAGGFDPRAISGLAVWYDAADTASVTLNVGNVAEWRDKSGNGRHMAQSTAANQPSYVTAGQNGRSVIRATAASAHHLRRESNGSVLTESLSYLGQTTHTILIAWKPASSTFSNYLYWANNNNSAGQRLQLTGPVPSASLHQYAFDSGSAATGRLSTTAVSGINNSAHVIAVMRNGASFAAWTSGAATGSADRASAPSISFSGQFSLFTGITSAGVQIDGGVAPSGYASGDLYEAMHYDRAITTDERRRIEAYLGAKWGITVA